MKCIVEKLTKNNRLFRELININIFMREKGTIDYSLIWGEYSKELEKRWNIENPETEWVTLFWASNTYFKGYNLSEYQIGNLAGKGRFRSQGYNFTKTNKVTKKVKVEKRIKVCLQDLEFYKLLLDLSKEFQNAELQRIAEHNETGEQIMEYVPLKQNKLGLSLPDVQISVLLQQLSNAKISNFVEVLSEVRVGRADIDAGEKMREEYEAQKLTQK